MTIKYLKKLAVFCLAVSLCMSCFGTSVMAVNEGEFEILDEFFVDANGRPLVDIPDEPIPITELPEVEEEPAAEEVEEPEEMDDLAEEEIPLAAVPRTGDCLGLWGAMSAAGLIGLAVRGKREKK